MLSIPEIFHLKENYPDITSMTNHNCQLWHKRSPVSTWVIYSVFALQKNKRKESGTKCLAENGCAARASVSPSNSGRRCPERWLSFYSGNVGSMAMTGIFKLPAEKIGIIQVRFLNINGRKKFRVRTSEEKRRQHDTGSRTNEVCCLTDLFLCVSHKARLNNHGLPFILQSLPTCPSSLWK